jgi:hypothetical protein
LVIKSKVEMVTGMNKQPALALILLLATSTLIIVGEASAWPSTPSVPEFTVKYVDYSYDIPPSYGTDPYNGQTIMTYSGDHIYNKTLEITIKNQPFTPSGDTNLYYNFRYKGVYEQIWHEGFGVDCIGMTPDDGNYRIQNYGAPTTFIRYTLPWDTPSTGKIDVQVQALMGKPIVSSNCRIIFSEYSYGFDGTTSAWSSTQTVTISKNSEAMVPPTSNPTPTTQPPQPTQNQTAVAPAQNPTQPPMQPNTEANASLGLDWKDIVIIVLAAAAAGMALAVLVSRRKSISSSQR